MRDRRAGCIVTAVLTVVAWYMILCTTVFTWWLVDGHRW